MADVTINYVDKQTREHGEFDVPEEYLDDVELVPNLDDLDTREELIQAWSNYLSDAVHREAIRAELDLRKIEAGGGHDPGGGGHAAGGGGAVHAEPAPQSQEAGEYRDAPPVTHVVLDVTKRSIYGRAPDAPAGQPSGKMEIRVPVRQYEMGPPDTTRAAFDALSPAGKDAAWQKYLSVNDLPPETYGNSSFAFLDDNPPLARTGAKAVGKLEVEGERKKVNRCKSCCDETSGSTKALIGLGALAAILVSIEEGVRNTAGANPQSVTATATWAANGASTVSVSWTAPFYASGIYAFSYRVTLINSANVAVASVLVDGAMTSTVLSNVPDGTYSVTVTALRPATTSGTGTATVTVAPPMAPPPPPAVAPSAPTAVNAVVSTMMGSTQRGITVTWTPGTGGGAVEHYDVTLTNAAGGTPQTKDAGTMTSAFFTLPADGTFTASVTARNTAGSSGAATSGSVVFTLNPGSVPGTPRNLTTATFRTGTAGQTGFVVAWDPPTTGDPLTSYTVTISGGPTAFNPRMTSSTIESFAPVADGTYQVSIVAGNNSGPGTAATTKVVVDASKIAADSVDWSGVFTADTETAWKTLQTGFTGATEAVFWQQIIDALTDAKGLYGGVASFAEQLTMARFLTSVLAQPVNDMNTDTQVPTLANRLATENPANESPFVRFPVAAPAAGAAWAGDPLVLWKRAAVIRNQMGTASLPIRRRLQALDLALSRYLGVTPSSLTPGG